MTAMLRAEIEYDSDAMKKRFVEASQTPGQLLDLRTLSQPMTLQDIKSEFDPQIVTEADIVATVGCCITGCYGIMMLFVMEDCVVRVKWDNDDRWCFASIPFGHSHIWFAGSQVFSTKFGS